MNAEISTVCGPCGVRYGNRVPRLPVTVSTGCCDVCGQVKPVNSVRDFGGMQPGWTERYADDVKKGIQPW